MSAKPSWTVASLRHLTTSIKDGTHGSFERVSDGVPLLSAKNVLEGYGSLSDSESLISKADAAKINVSGNLRRGDVLLTIVGTIGRTAIFDLSEQVAFQRSVAMLRPTRRVLNRFLYWQIQSSGFQDELSSRVKQSAQGGVYLGDVGDIHVSSPPLSTQRAIVDFLDRKTRAIDELIRKKERLIELLQEKRQALITQAVTKGLPAEAAAEAGLDPNVPMKDSGVPWLGEIPAHWEVKRLKHLAQVRGGVTKGRNLKGRATIELPYLRVANVQDGFLDLSEIASIEIEPSELARYALHNGDVLMNEGGDFDKLGRGCVWNGEIAPCLHQNHVFAVRPNTRVDPRWIAVTTSTAYLKHFFMLRSKQSTNLASISSSNLKEAPVVWPPTQEQAAILRHISERAVRIERTENAICSQVEKVREYRQALISAAVTGQIDVTCRVAPQTPALVGYDVQGP